MEIIEGFFLNKNEVITKNMFSLVNFIILLVTFLIILLLIINKNKFKCIDSTKIRYIVGSVLVVNWLLRRGSFIYFEVYNYKYHLDIGFCNLTSILFMIYCFTNSKKLYKLVYYLGFSTLLIAIMFPSVNYTFSNYYFYSFIINHHMNFIMIILFFWTNQLEYKTSDFYKSFVLIIVIYVIIHIFNGIMGTHYNLLPYLINSSLLEFKFIEFICSNFWLSNIFCVCLGLLFMNCGRIFFKIYGKRDSK